jgi:hypothetical protein
MIRPYGSIGQFSPNMHDPFSFGTTAYFDPFSRLADLGTSTDQKSKHDVAAMNDALTGATLIIFIGFGYHPSNVDLIKLAAGNGSPLVIGTVTGIHNSNRDLIAERIASNLRMGVGRIDLRDMKCRGVVARAAAAYLDAGRVEPTQTVGVWAKREGGVSS